MQKAVDAEAKAAFWPRFYICNTNQYCLQGSCPAYFTTAKILFQGHQIKDLQSKELKKPQKPKAPAPQRFKNIETSEKAWKEKKNDCRHQRGHQIPKDGRPQEGSTRPPGSITFSTRKVKIQKRTKTEALGKTQPRLPAGIATKKATMQISA